MIQRLVEPCLPNWPPLFTDTGNGHCFVSTRISDWRSIEQANALAGLLIGTAFFLLAWILWRVVPPYSDELYRWLVIVGCFAPFALVVFPLLRSNLPTLLAKTLFARRLNLIFTPDAIGLQSHFYRRALKLQRLITDKTVNVQFLLAEDSEATSEAHKPPKPGENLGPRLHLIDARIVEMVIRSSDERIMGQQASIANRFRSIPITRVEKKRGEWLVVVLNAAFSMTKRRDQNCASRGPTRGQDLDAPTIEVN